jgi:hypothetical protein
MPVRMTVKTMSFTWQVKYDFIRKNSEVILGK